MLHQMDILAPVMSPNSHIGCTLIYLWCRGWVHAVWYQKPFPRCIFRNPAACSTKWTYWLLWCYQMVIFAAKLFICDAEVECMLFDTKNHALDVFLENQLHAPPNGHIGPCDVTKWSYWLHIDLFVMPRLSACCLNQKPFPRCIFRKPATCSTK